MTLLYHFFDVCNSTVMHNNKPWFAIAPVEPRWMVSDVFSHHINHPFRVRVGEIVYFRDDCSLSLPFVTRDRILFPTYCRGDCA